MVKRAAAAAIRRVFLEGMVVDLARRSRRCKECEVVVELTSALLVVIAD